MRFLVVILVFLLVACAETQEEPSSASAPALRVEYAGCRTVLEGPLCVLGQERRLTVWVKAPREADVQIGSGELESPPVLEEAVQGGRRYSLTLTDGAAALTITARWAAGTSQWTLGLVAASMPALLTQASEALNAYRLEEAESLVREGLESLPVQWRGNLLGVLGRIAFMRGDAKEARQYLRETVAADYQYGRLYDGIRDSTMLVHSLLDERQFTEARDRLGALSADWGGPAEATTLVAYYAGLLALYTGDARSALRHLSSAAGQAQRLGLERLRRISEQVLAEQYQKIGRRDRSRALLVRLRDEAPPNLHACERGQLLNNLAWNGLLAREAGEPAEDVTPLLEEALTLFTDECPDMIGERTNVLVNLALAHLHAGRFAPAASRLAEAEDVSGGSQLRMVLWWRDIEARIALASGHQDEALARYDALEELAKATLSPEIAWRAAVGRAQALEAAGNVEAALQAFSDADTRVGQESLQVPVQEGRETFLARRQWATRQHLDLLLNAQRVEQAFDLARRSRSRALRSLRREERLTGLDAGERQRWDAAIAAYQAERESLAASAADDWRLPSDALARLGTEREAQKRQIALILDDAFAVLDRHAPEAEAPLTPAAGETVLLYQPLPEGWVGFSHNSEGVAAHRLDCDPAVATIERLAQCLLTPFSAAINAAERIRILAYGTLRAVDFHALPFGEDVLLSRHAVAYGLDLGQSSEALTPSLRNALVVADPRGDLPAARTEVATVVASLEEAGLEQVSTLQGLAVDAAALRRELPGLDLFHYAGHAEFAGVGGWDSALPLAEPGHFTVADILALESAPRWVVLSGCETGRTSVGAAPDGIGLAHAFLSNGSQAVLAAVRPVADTTAAMLVRAFYESWTDGASVVTALQRAQLKLRINDPGADWSSFRLILP